MYLQSQNPAELPSDRKFIATLAAMFILFGLIAGVSAANGSVSDQAGRAKTPVGHTGKGYLDRGYLDGISFD